MSDRQRARFAVPVQFAVYNRTVIARFWAIDGHQVPEEIFAAAVVELGGQYPPADDPMPGPRETYSHVYGMAGYNVVRMVDTWGGVTKMVPYALAIDTESQ